MDLFPVESWDRLNEALAKSFLLQDGEQALAFSSLAEATQTVLLGLAQVYSHKRSIAVVKGNSWALEFCLPWFLREAYQVQTIELAEVQKDPVGWVQGLKKDTVFVLFAEDHPVTLQTWDWGPLAEAAHQQKFFTVGISHSRFISDRPSLSPMATRICSIGDDLSVVLTGPRVRINTETVALRPWDLESVIDQLHKRLGTTQDPALVQNFEKEFSDFALLDPETPRFFDRAILSFPNVGGEALAERLEKALGPSRGVQTLHACHWDSLRLFQKWWQPAPTPEELRGSLLLSLEILQTKDFAKILRQTYEDLQSQQSW